MTEVTFALYRVTHLVDSNLPLTSKQKFCIGLACPDLARPKQNLCFDVNGRFESTRCVTLYTWDQWEAGQYNDYADAVTTGQIRVLTKMLSNCSDKKDFKFDR